MPHEAAPATLLYRDALMLVIDKPAGLPVHPGRRGGRTLSDELDGLRFGLPRRPEAAHRLDRDTSGCLILGRHRQALAKLGRLFKAGRIGKIYWAEVEGGPAAGEGEIDVPLAPRSPDPATWWMKADPAGLPSRTLWRVLGRDGRRSWLELRPLTGRTHQLRVHCAESGWPILGDAIYGSGRTADGFMQLHARAVTVPLYGGRPDIAVEAPGPGHMMSILEQMNGCEADS